MKFVDSRPLTLSISGACDALELSRASYYREKAPAQTTRPRRSHRALTTQEKQGVLDTLCEERFQDHSVSQVWARLLDEGTYLCSRRTMYRILAENRAVRERRNQLRHPNYTKPELLATGPNQVWSWDITKLKGPHKWNYFHLYVILDIYSRKTVGWMVANRESATLAVELIRQTCEREGIDRNQLTIHADRGTSMRSKPVAFLLADLGINKTHSRPYTSTDNPYSEAQFKTLKYKSTFPKRFGSIEDAREFLRGFFDWYNNEHRHSGIGLVTPQQRHSGEDQTVYTKRGVVLDLAFVKHPERFVHGQPKPPEMPGEVWINKPEAA